MTPVFQKIVGEYGDCMRAALASLFDLELDQVPHFRLYDKSTSRVLHNKSRHGNCNGMGVFFGFLECLGWQWNGSGYPDYKNKSDGAVPDQLDLNDSVDGYFYAIVKSRTLENVSHAVVMDKNWIIVHDPNPNQLFKNVNAYETRELKSWFLLSRYNGSN